MKLAIVQLLSKVVKKRQVRHTKTLFFGVGFFVLAGFLLSVGFVHAAADADVAKIVTDALGGGVLASMTNNVINAIILGMAQIFSTLTAFMLKMTMFSLRFFIELAGYNNFINAPAVIVGWFMIRDIANMLFIVALLVIAFSTILGIEKYEWKKALGQLIIAAVLINFSRLLLGWVIDISHLFMVAFLNAIQGAAGGNIIQMLNLDKIMSMTGGDLNLGSKEASESLRLELFAASFAGFMFATMAFLSIAAYSVVLLTRVLALWMLIILSPLAFVLQAIPQAKSYASEFWADFTKYVIVGPVAVFFLWLAFASLGNGDIGSHIGIKGQTTDETKALQTSRSTQTITLSEATRWDNLSAYFIAVGFLFLGLERVQKLGVKGGSLVSAATNFGGKVATIASGVAAGRWLGRKSADVAMTGAKIGLAKAPIIGGDAWKRRGTAIAGRAKLFSGKVAERRNELASGAEQSLKKQQEARQAWIDGGKVGAKPKISMGARLSAGLGASLLETGGRKMKRAKDWQEAAERQAKVVEESYSTSSTSASGKAKTDATARLQIVEDLAKEKGNAKVAERREQLMGESGRDGDRARTRMDKMAESRARSDEIGKNKEADLSARVGRKRQGEVAAMGADGRLTTRAENLADIKEMGREKEVQEAEVEAQELRKRGRHVEAQAKIKSVYQKQFKEDQDEYEKMEYNERVSLGSSMAKQIKALDSSSTPLTPAQTKELQNLRKDAVKLVTTAARNGTEELDEVLNTMVTEVYGGVAQTMSNENSGQRIMEAISGRQISTHGEFDDAHNLLNGSSTFRDEAESQAVQSAMANALKAQAMSGGGVKYAGAIMEDKNSANNSLLGRGVVAGAPVGYRLAANKHLRGTAKNPIISEDYKGVEGVQGYVGVRTNLKQAKDLRGFMATKAVAGGGSKVEDISTTQLDNLEHLLSGFGDARAVASGFSSTSSKGNKMSEFDTEARDKMVAMLLRVKANYASGDESTKKTFNKLLNTQFKDWSVSVGGEIPV